MDFAVPEDHREKNEKKSLEKDKYLDLARELKQDYHIYQTLRSGRIWHKVDF